MTTRRMATLLLSLFALACAETTAPERVPIAVSWLEWPASVVAGVRDSMRIVGVRPCGSIFLDVEVDRGAFRTLTVRSEAGPPSNTCSIDGFPGPSYDTTIALPVLDVVNGLPTPYTVRATVVDPVSGEPVTLRLGTLDADVAGRIVRKAAGQATLVADSLGCAWAYAERYGPREPLAYPLLSPPNLANVSGRRALVGGLLVPVDPPGCGVSTALALDFVALRLLP